MANKKKKPVKRKSKKVVEPEHSPFWALSGAVLLIVAAFLLLLGGFGTGGPLPVNMFEGTYWALGWVAYLTPLALAYWGIHKFNAEDRRIPLSNLLGMLAVLIFASAWAHTAFASKSGDSWDGGQGGELG